MVKIKTITRSEDDRGKIKKSLNPEVHPFERAREYTRALNAVKLQKVFAKPFIGQLSGHSDGVSCLSRHPKNLQVLASGACDGEIITWNVAYKQPLFQVQAHKGFVKGLAFTQDGDYILSCGTDQTVKLWDLQEVVQKKIIDSLQEKEEMSFDNISNIKKHHDPVSTWLGPGAFTSIDYQRNSSCFATTCGADVLLWDLNKNNHTHKYAWGSDTASYLKFNPVETYVLATLLNDRSITLFDTRGKTALKKVYLAMKSNSLSWNPVNPFNFVVANEDTNLYTFDIRNLSKVLYVHKDHVSAVLDVDYSPTGQEFCSGSYDRSIRIFEEASYRSREVYHTQRMQRIFTVRYSADSKYIFSGSDDMNIRIWKTVAHEPLRHVTPREKAQLQYSQKLIERYKNVPELASILRYRRVPKAIFNAKRVKTIMNKSAKRKLMNRLKHSKPGKIKVPTEKRKRIVAVEE
mmetsp:Transcript_14930/g.20866  ORF Transcript_14930/g.20866 Transcript_14930/m.20866 type:complete len:461 (+) Transcript_14930:59-1441(+)